MSGWGMALDSKIRLKSLEKRQDAKTMKAIGVAAITIIREETQKKGIDENGRKFKPYTEEYAAFRKEEGRQSKRPDLTFTGAMLNNMIVVEATKESVTIGFLDSTPARGGLKPSQKMKRTNKKRPWFGFGSGRSKRRIKIEIVGREIYLRGSLSDRD
jgi:hypothetical protein